MTDQEQLKQDFLEEWPLERVKEMSIDEYTNLNRNNSFCYWLESRTQDIGSIWGGSSYKFGIYKRNNTDSEDSRSGYSTDGEYAWVSKYGGSIDEAFEKVRSIIVSIIKAAQNDSLEEIDSIDLGNAVKWKIAFLYSDYKVINIFKTNAIYEVAGHKGLSNAEDKPISVLHRFLIEKKPEDKSYFDYTTELWQQYSEEEEVKDVKVMKNILDTKLNSLNTILFGPPGTGKTYHTVDYALRVVAPKFYEENKSDREKLVQKFQDLLITDWDNPGKGRIATTTFHQSFTYEDFIEGIKPELTSNNKQKKSDSEEEEKPAEEEKDKIRYTIEDGVFKRISEQARQDSGGAVKSAKDQLKWSNEDFEKAEFYKVSLGNVNIPGDEEIYEYCIENNKIAIGFLNDVDLTGYSSSQIMTEFCGEGKQAEKHDCLSMGYFINDLKKDYYIIVPDGNNYFRAIGKVTGDYEYNPDAGIRYNHFRDVEWLVTDFSLPVDLVYDKTFSTKTIYNLRKEGIKPEFFVESKARSETTENDAQPYVLIIDEINRGNIAQIFGELITLIEEDKREGKREALKATLPYSKDTFSVPSNLHIVGTMNTADRSVEALDTALRRRFQFREVPPRPHVIVKEGKADNGTIRINGSSIDLSNLLKTINTRIEKVLDKDHLIGHSYFMDITNWKDLRTVFNQNIIPLLEEYFYGDKGKVQLILGMGFIESVDGQENEEIFPDTEYNDQGIFEDRIVWRIKDDWRESEENFLNALSLLDIQN